MKTKLLFLALFLGFTATAAAQVTFTITATANADGFGYTNGQAYTFIFTTPGNYAFNPDSAFDSSHQSYNDEQLSTDDNLFTSISGSGLTGSFTRPVDQDWAPFSFVIAGNPDALQLLAASDSGSSIGLQTLDFTEAGSVYVNLSLATATFAFPETYQTPADYFSSVAGTYSAIDGFNGSVELSPISFTATSLTISVAAIPEPATTAGLLGLAGLGMVFFARRRGRGLSTV